MRETGMVLQLTCDCELGRCGERAVVVYVSEWMMTLVFPMRPAGDRVFRTGRDYKFCKEV